MWALQAPHKAKQQMPSRRPKRERRARRSGPGSGIQGALSILTNKRSPPKSSKTSSNGPRIVLTGFDGVVRDQLVKKIETIGGNVVETCGDDGVCVTATDDQNNVTGPRRLKLLNALCVNSNIVSREWIDASTENGAFLPTKAYSIPVLIATIERGIVARDRGGLFEGWAFYLHNSVSAKKGNPSKKELATLFDNTGGKKVDAGAIGRLLKSGGDVSKLIIIAEEGVDLPKKVSEAIQLGAKQLRCPKFVEAVAKQLLSFEHLFSRPTHGTISGIAHAHDAISGIAHDVAASGAISGIAHAHSNVPESSSDAESSKDDDGVKSNLTTLKKLHLEAPREKAAREAKEARTTRMMELAGLLKKKKSEIANHAEGLDATLSKMTERQDEDLALLKERQKIKMAEYIAQHDHELVVATTAHSKEREGFVESHTKRGVALSADRYALMKELLELENEDQPRPRPGRDLLLGTFFLPHLQRNTTVGLDDILELGEVLLEVYSEGPDRGKKFARMARFEGDRGTVIFLADAPKAGEGMFGNAGNQPIVVWQAFNEKHVQAGGTTIKGAQDPLKSTGSRRYHLHFESNEDVERFLDLLGISLEEWNDPGGRFCPQTSIAPANKHELNDSDMEVEAQNKTITEEDAEKLFGYDPYEVSQKY